jgi:hypothetical protein
MDAKQAIDIGIKIAEEHAIAVTAMMRECDVTAEKALHGNKVWLATQIMKAMQQAEQGA